jgi:hypothetical protein
LAVVATRASTSVTRVVVVAAAPPCLCLAPSRVIHARIVVVPIDDFRPHPCLLAGTRRAPPRRSGDDILSLLAGEDVDIDIDDDDDDDDDGRATSRGAGRE